MPSLNEKLFSVKTQKIQLLIVGRLLVIFLLLLASWFWNGGHLNFSVNNFPRQLFVVFLISTGLTIVYSFFLKFSRGYEWQVRVQFAADAMLITWLIWHTGNLTSPFITLYIVLISVSSLFLKARETLVVSALCVSVFTTLSVLAITQYDPFITSSLPETSKIIQIVGFHNVAFLVVGLLAARLADRSASGEKLKEATKSLADLRALHERIIDSIRSGLITTDLDGKIYTFNPAAGEITGYTAAEMRDKSISTLLGDLEQQITLSLEASEAGEAQPRFTTDVMTPEGFAVHIGYNISPLFSETGFTTGLIITFQDLTQVRSMEESVRRKDRLAAVGRVAAGLAHEIRNPLGAMRGAIQVLESSMPPESTQSKLMDIILRESDRLNKIITNFLTYARPRVSNFTETDVREAINDTFMLLKHSPDIKEKHTLEVNLPDKPIFVSADGTQLKQIFWNLARNAVQAMPDGGKLSMGLDTVSANRIRITFSDTGCGMSPAQVEQLFEPFSNSTTGGTGLGLSIVYQIVRDHGGTINVRSREGEGTTITVELPTEIKDARAEEENEIENSVAPSRLGEFLNVK